MTDIPPLFLVLNIVFVVLAVFLTNRMMRAVSKYNWSPGDGEMQNKQKFIILKSIIKLAVLALFAAIVNIFFG